MSELKNKVIQESQTAADHPEVEYLVNKNIPGNMLFAVKEAYKTIRANLVLSILKPGCKTVVITSSVSADGKSTTAVNLSISLSQINQRVLLIDADLRKPKIHKYLSLKSSPGLTDIITGQAPFETAVQITKYPDFHVLCAGISVPNPSELLAGNITLNLLNRLQDSYDYIILDTPPVNVVSDMLPLVKVADGALLIVRQYQSNHRELQKAVKSLEFIGGKILGFVFIGTENNRKFSKKYGKNYGYYDYYSEK